MNQTADQPILETERLLLRGFTLADAEPLFPLINDREIARNTRTIPHPYPEDGAAKWIETLTPLWEEGKSVHFAICLKEQENALTGAIGLDINSENEHAELGYWIGRKFWNSGICSEAAAAVIGFGFRELGLEKIHAHHVTRNPASGKVMINNGMRQEGLLRNHIKKWGVFEDVAWFGILKSEWEATSV